MSKIIKHLTVLSLVYFATRLPYLTSLPVFGDEAIYIRWSQIIRNVETLRFIPLTDGKQPLFMWLVAFFGLPLFSDPLIAGRFISVISGWSVMLAVYLSTLIFVDFSKSSRSPLVAGLLYLFLPFTFFFDRLALADTLLSFFAVISFALTWLMVKSPRLDLSLILGAVLGLAWITKSPALYFVCLSFATIVIYHPRQFYFPLLSAALAFFIFNLLRLGPQFHMIASRNLDYVWPLTELIRHPLDPLTPHLGNTLVLFFRYVSLPFLFILFFRPSKKNLILFSWFFLPLLATAAVAKIYTARYILFSIPFLIILISLAFNRPQNRLLPFLALSLIPNLIFMAKLARQPYQLNLPTTESGYLQDWTSGWGIKSAAEYLKSQAQEHNVIVGTEGNFGTLPDGLQIYTQNTNQLTVIGVGLNFNQVPEPLVNAKNFGDQVYLLINRSRLKLETPYHQLNIIQQYPKPDGDQLLLIKI